MRKSVLLFMALCALPTQRSLTAQDRALPAPPELGAEFLLANTGRLALTDQQVVKLAAIARREYQRREALRARMDSLRRRPEGGEAVPEVGPHPGGAPPPRMKGARDQEHAALAEAIKVLTPEQQAIAWEIVAAAPRPAGPAEGPVGPPPGRGRSETPQPDRSMPRGGPTLGGG